MDKKKRVMRSLTITELSGVDAPAQTGARAVIMKRAAGCEAESSPVKTVLDVDMELERMARENRGDDESMEQAYVRLIDERDPDFAALLEERDQAARHGATLN